MAESELQDVSATHGRLKRGLWFAFWNLLSFAAMFAIFFAVRDVEGWDGLFRASFRFFYQHETLAVLAAMMPFFASLLVGWGYARRAMRRRQREAAAQATQGEPKLAEP